MESHWENPQRKSIPPLALWLTAMNVVVIFNRPRRPTDNAKVERMQRTTKNWAQVKDCEDITQEYIKQIVFAYKKHTGNLLNSPFKGE